MFQNSAKMCGISCNALVANAAHWPEASETLWAEMFWKILPNKLAYYKFLRDVCVIQLSS
jgi:hypothetical protein